MMHRFLWKTALFAAMTLAVVWPDVPAQTPEQMATPTVIAVDAAVRQAGVKRLGINLGGQLYWDSGQIMKNLAFRNPGFEGETWQSILHCAAVTANTCTDDNAYSVWPSGFFLGAQVSFINGANNGLSSTVTRSTAVDGAAKLGVTVTFSSLAHPVAVGDYMIVRMTVPGGAETGWWTSASGGATFSTDTTDLSPNTPGKQALQMNASGSGQEASVSSYFDTLGTQSFLQMNGSYTVTFRAKALGGSDRMWLQVRRVLKAGGTNQFLGQQVTLSKDWQDYSFTFNAADTGDVGSLQLGFDITGGSMDLDDVSLRANNTLADNPSEFRDEVVTALKTLRPGIIRYMDSGTNWGSSLDNMLAPQFARQRPGYSNYQTQSTDIPIGLHDFLVLCKTVGAEPWYTLQGGMSTVEVGNLMEYLGGSSATKYGGMRAGLGQSEPWTAAFAQIHLEFGNEVWNGANSGATMQDPLEYGKRAGAIFGVAHGSPYYTAKGFDLIVDGWAVLPYWNTQVLSTATNYDSIGIAPYLFDNFNDASSQEAIFGSMFAQPEMLDDTPAGYVYQQAQVAAAAPHPTKMAIYETNISTLHGSVDQATLDGTVPSVAAGIASSEHMLTMLRDLGVVNQTMFALVGFGQNFYNPSATTGESSPIYGTVHDMGNGNRVRPTFLAEQMANAAILPTMLTATQTGANPTWDVASVNDSTVMQGAHYIQSYAFTDGTTNNLILFNLSRTQALPVALTGSHIPAGRVSVRTLTSANLTDSNESAATVGIAESSMTVVDGQAFSLPPFSMTVLSGAAGTGAGVQGVTVRCDRTSVAAGGVASCTASVTGVAPYRPDVVWTVSAGTITQDGDVTAPAAAGTVTVTATSAQAPGIAGSASLAVVANAATAISGVTISATATTATIAWATNVATSSGVDWGTTASYGSVTPWTNAVSKTPAYTLTGLTPGTLYYLVLWSYGPDGETQVLATVTTPGAGKPLAIHCAATALTAGGTTRCTAGGKARVTWAASAGTISPGGVLTAPADAGTVTVTATNSQGMTGSAAVTVTAPAGTVISGIKTAVSATTATISWETNVVTSSGMDWGPTESYENVTPWTPDVSATPSYTLTGLTPGTVYYVAAWSYGPQGIALSRLTVRTADE